MEAFSAEQCEDAQEFASFYFDLLENHKETFSYYLSDGAVLDWFGRTIKGVSNIRDFVKFHMGTVRHMFAKVEPCHKIGYRKTHIVEYALSRAAEAAEVSDVKAHVPQEKTPPNPTIASSSRKRDKGQGNAVRAARCESESPAKRTRLSDDGDAIEAKIANVCSTGHLEFSAKSCKKYQKETKWQRPCTFQVSYSKMPTGYVVHLIIYKGNMRCRRNLMNDFDAVANQE